MNHDAILSLLDHLCNEARNSMHASFGLADFQPETATGLEWQICADASRSSADRLLRAIDDMREMLSGQAPDAASVEEFDFVKSVKDTACVLNMTAGDGAEDRTAKLAVESLEESIIIRHSRRALEQMLVRVLNLAARLSAGGIVQVTISRPEMDRVSAIIAPPVPDLACRLANWINADVDQVNFHENDVPTLVAALVVGRRLHAIGGIAEPICSEGETPRLAIYVPRRSWGAGSPDAAPSEKRLQVLVAEDCDESFALTALLLRNEHIDRARSGLEAIDQVMQRRYDIVFMDVHMPEMDGYEAIRSIRQWETQSANARTPIVVLSSDDIVTQKWCAAQAGCSGFLRKPIRQADLVEVLKPLRATHDPAA